MATDITIHNLDDQLVRRLHQEAKRRGVPIDAVVAEALDRKFPATTQASIPNGAIHRDVTGLAGVFTADDAREFFNAIKDLEEVDEELWK